MKIEEKQDGTYFRGDINEHWEKFSKYNQLKKAIIKAVPEIVKLKKNCKVKHKELGYIKTVAFVDKKYGIVQYIPQEYGKEAHDILEHYNNDKFKIIGRDITLEDCLIAIDKKNLNYAMTSTGYFIKYGGVIGNSLTHKITNIKWQPNKSLRWHYENKPETIDFLHDLICNK